MADMVPVVCRVLDQIETRDWDALAPLLSPDVHWTNAIEEHFHGRNEVIEMSSSDPPPAPPAHHEYQNGMIIRWIDCPG
ncbi:MAG: nuclear transport factor 2 family protein [Solirubrobacterales bacterium]